MTLEKEALQFVEKLGEYYYEKRDMEELETSMSDNISLIGTGAEEICRGLTDVSAALNEDLAEYQGAFTLQKFSLQSVQLDEYTCLVYGEIYVNAQDPEIAGGRYRLSVICRKTERKMQLLHLHLSKSDPDQKTGELHVKKNEILEKEQLIQEIQYRNTELEEMNRNMPGAVHQRLNDRNFTLLTIGDSFITMFGYTREEITDGFHNLFIEMIYPPDRRKINESVQAQLMNGREVELEYRVVCGDGTVKWILDRGKLAETFDGKQVFYCVLVDITKRKQDQEELRLSLERHKVILDQTTDIIFEWDIRKDTLNYSSNWRVKFGYDPIEREISKKVPQSKDIYPEDMPAFMKLLRDTSTGTPYSEVDLRIRNAQNEYSWCHIRATAQFDKEGKPVKVVGVIIDVDFETKLKQELMVRAQQDALTGLLNKAAAKELTEAYLKSGDGRNGVLFIIDLDNFKQINDRYGHLCGDAVLSDTAAALKNTSKANTVTGRIGGDEFLIYIPDIDTAHILEKAEEILSRVGRISLKNGEGKISCSIGAAVYPATAADFNGLYRCADSALYYVKKNGKGGFMLYSESLCPEGVTEGIERSAIGTVIDSDEMGSVNEKLVQYSIQMLYSSIDTGSAVNQILEIVGRAYDVSRVYIFENSEDERYCDNTFEWCNVGVEPEIEHLQHLSYMEDLGDYHKNFTEDGVFYCRNIRTLHPDLYGVLEPQGIVSLLQCAILDDGEFKGYVGFDECRECRYWTKEQIKSLTLIANVLSTFLLKVRLKEKLARLEGKLER